MEPRYLKCILMRRNAFDWTASMFRNPWHATNHCNVTFPEFMDKEWSPGRLAGKHPCSSHYNLLHTLCSSACLALLEAQYLPTKQEYPFSPSGRLQMGWRHTASSCFLRAAGTFFAVAMQKELVAQLKDPISRMQGGQTGDAQPPGAPSMIPGTARSPPSMSVLGAPHMRAMFWSCAPGRPFERWRSARWRCAFSF